MAVEMEVFVYGTLRRGCGNHHILKNTRPIGFGTFPGTMYSFGDYPAVTEKEGNAAPVYGELYTVDDDILEDLDSLEEHPRFYEREEREIFLCDGRKVWAWIYLMDTFRAKGQDTVPGGDWVYYLHEKAQAVWYFAYGSNMNPRRMEKRNVPFLYRGRGRLKDYTLMFNKRASGHKNIGYANIVPWPGGLVEGALYTVMPGGLEVLDGYEDAPLQYSREIIAAEDDWGRKVAAAAYIARPDKVKDGLCPDEEYLSHLLKGEDILSRDYYKELKQTECLGGTE